VLQCVAVCCSVLKCFLWCIEVLQVVHDFSLQYSDVCGSVVQRGAVCCSVLQCVAVCCSVLQCVVMCCRDLLCIAVLQVAHDYALQPSEMC